MRWPSGSYAQRLMPGACPGSAELRGVVLAAAPWSDSSVYGFLTTAV